MMQWICDAKLKQCTNSKELRRKLDLLDIEEELIWENLRYYGYLLHMDDKNLMQASH